MAERTPDKPLSTATLPGQEFVTRLLESSPPGVARTFTAEQLEAIQQVFAEAGYTSQSTSDVEWWQGDVEEAGPRTSTASRAPHPSLGDRRRPGRSEYVHPTLISLLRRPTSAIEADLGDDDIRPAQGLATAILLSLPVVLLVGIVVVLLLFGL
jgi:hypothetical protein